LLPSNQIRSYHYRTVVLRPSWIQISEVQSTTHHYPAGSRHASSLKGARAHTHTLDCYNSDSTAALPESLAACSIHLRQGVHGHGSLSTTTLTDRLSQEGEKIGIYLLFLNPSALSAAIDGQGTKLTGWLLVGAGPLGAGGLVGGVLGSDGAGEGAGEVGVEVNDAGDVGVELSDERHVARQPVRVAALLVLADLPDQHAVVLQDLLHLAETPLQHLRQLAAVRRSPAVAVAGGPGRERLPAVAHFAILVHPRLALQQVVGKPPLLTQEHLRNYSRKKRILAIETKRKETNDLERDS
jgi:hypothetical protein